jgi:hypothetical protein
MKLHNETNKYWKAFGVKILENLASVKVWFFILPFIASTMILSWLVGSHVGFIKMILLQTNPEIMVSVIEQMQMVMDMFIAWCTFNVSLAGTIIVIRETFKVKKLVALNDEEKDNSEVIENINS